MKLLALDCSTSSCSAALINAQSDGEPQLTSRVEQAARQHTQRILPMIDELLSDCETSLQQLDGIAVGRGPGSFTGLRISLSVAQGLAYGADLPVVKVSTLAAQVQAYLSSQPQKSACGNQQVLSTIDARMNEIYWALYRLDAEAATFERLGDEQLCAPESISIPELQTCTPATAPFCAALGSGHHYVEQMTTDLADLDWRPDIYPSAEAIARLAIKELERGHACAAQQVVPTYLREQVAWQKIP